MPSMTVSVPLPRRKDTGDIPIPEILETEKQFIARILVATRAGAKHYYRGLQATGAIPSRQRLWYELRTAGLSYSQILRVNIETAHYGKTSIARSVEAYAKKHGLPVPEDSTVEDYRFYRTLEGFNAY